MNVHKTIKAKPAISAVERARRQEEVTFATGSVRFEGFTMSAETEELDRRYIAGEVDFDEVLATTLKRCAVG